MVGQFFRSNDIYFCICSTCSKYVDDMNPQTYIEERTPGRIISFFSLKETLFNLVSFSFNFFFTNVMFVCRSSYHLPLHLRLNGRSIKLSGPDTIYWKFVTQIPSRDDLDVPPRRLYPTKCGNFSAELKPAKKDQCPLLLGMWTNTFYNLNQYILQFLSFSFLVGRFAPNLKKRWLLGMY